MNNRVRQKGSGSVFTSVASDETPLTSGQTALSNKKYDWAYLLASGTQLMVGIALVVSSGIIMSGGMSAKDTDGGTKTDKGGFRFDLIFGERVVYSTNVYIYLILFSVMLVGGIAMIVEFFITASGICAPFQKFIKFKDKITNWKIRGLIQHSLVCLTWGLIEWCLMQSAGERDAKILVASLVIVISVTAGTYFTRMVGGIISNLYDTQSVNGSSQSDSEDPEIEQIQVPSDTSALMGVWINIFAFITIGFVALVPELFRWYAFLSEQKYTGAVIHRTNALWAAHIMFSSAYYLYILINLGEGLLSAWHGSTSYVVKIIFYMFPFGPVNGLATALGWLANKTRITRGKDAEAIFNSMLNGIVLLGISWILYMESITVFVTVPSLPTT
jgi:hypothetical protein